MGLSHDIRYAGRMLGKSPVFTVVAALSLALGIGAGTSVFSLINAIMLRSMPVPNPHELRLIEWRGADWESWEDNLAGMGSVDRSNTMRGYDFSLRGWRALRERCAAQADFAGFSQAFAVFRARQEPVSLAGLMVSDNFFSVLSVRPLLGRGLSEEDERPGAPPAVVISYRLWDQQFARDAEAIGRQVMLGAFSFQIVGVLPRAFSGVHAGVETDFYVSLSTRQLQPRRVQQHPDVWWVTPVARLKPGVSDAQLQAAASVVFLPEAELIKMKDPKFSVVDGRSGIAEIGKTYRALLPFLLAVVGMVLLVACANLAGLMLARGAARLHEFAVRAALGAGRGHLIRQALIESALIAGLGAALGLMIATWGKTVLGRLVAGAPEGLHYDTSFDFRVLGFTLAIALVTALLSGLLPALRAARVDPLEGLKERSLVSLPRLRAGRFLVLAQIVVSLVVVSGAGLMVRSLIKLTHVPLGYTLDHMLVFQLYPGAVGPREKAQLVALFDRVLEALSALPGARSVALALGAPLELPRSGLSSNRCNVSGGEFASGYKAEIFKEAVNETFFTTMGMPLLQGRDLGATDNAGAPKVVVVNETFVRRYLPGRDPIGVTITEMNNRGDWQIVGVCRDSKYLDVAREAEPMLFRSFRQVVSDAPYFLLRTAVPPLTLAAAVRKTVAAIEPLVPVDNLGTLEQGRDATINWERTYGILCGALAVLALFLSCLGLYGLMACQVAHRTGEIGIRQALGATRWQVAWPILRDVIMLTGIGIIISVPLTVALVRMLRWGFYGIAVTDPANYCGSAALFLIIALIAAWVPARRAARIDPMAALRSE